MYKAKQIAQWFINKSIEEVANGGEYITNLKLQKLLYYSQGCYGAIHGTKLFEENIYNWAHGPVVKEVYHEFKRFGDSGIDELNEVKVDEQAEAVLLEVNKVFGRYSAWALRNMTHDEDPWKNTQRDDIIPFEAIKKYFADNIVVA